MQSLFVVVIVLLCSLAKSNFQTGFKIEIKGFFVYDEYLYLDELLFQAEGEH